MGGFDWIDLDQYTTRGGGLRKTSIGISWLPDELLTCEEGLCCLELIVMQCISACSVMRRCSEMWCRSVGHAVGTAPYLICRMLPSYKTLLYVPPPRSRNLRCAHAVFMSFVWIWEQTGIISLYSINWLVFITETECVYCSVRTGSLCIILRSAHTVYLWVLCGSENKQRLFPYTALTDWFL